MNRPRRRCLDCGRLLPADANPRRSFCGQACVARAYRKRVRLQERRARRLAVIHLFGQLTRAEKAGIITRSVMLSGVQCPVCGKVVWQGVRRRTDAVYCSNACKCKAARGRRQP